MPPPAPAKKSGKGKIIGIALGAAALVVLLLLILPSLRKQSAASGGSQPSVSEAAPLSDEEATAAFDRLYDALLLQIADGPDMLDGLDYTQMPSLDEFCSLLSTLRFVFLDEQGIGSSTVCWQTDPDGYQFACAIPADAYDAGYDADSVACITIFPDESHQTIEGIRWNWSNDFWGTDAEMYSDLVFALLPIPISSDHDLMDYLTELGLTQGMLDWATAENATSRDWNDGEREVSCLANSRALYLSRMGANPHLISFYNASTFCSFSLYFLNDTAVEYSEEEITAAYDQIYDALLDNLHFCNYTGLSAEPDVFCNSMAAEGFLFEQEDGTYSSDVCWFENIFDHTLQAFAVPQWAYERMYMGYASTDEACIVITANLARDSILEVRWKWNSETQALEEQANSSVFADFLPFLSLTGANAFGPLLPDTGESSLLSDYGLTQSMLDWTVNRDKLIWNDGQRTCHYFSGCLYLDRYDGEADMPWEISIWNDPNDYEIALLYHYDAWPDWIRE